MMRDEYMENLAFTLYSDDLPYHNFGHIRTVIRKGNEIVERCKKEHVAIQEDIVYYALLYHDAGYNENHVAKGYSSKEAYSADLAVEQLSGNGIVKEKLERIKAAILCTHVDAHCATNEDKAVRAADLSELAADYRIFKKNTLDLKKELEQQTGSTISWNSWKRMAVEKVEEFLREELHLTSDYYDEKGDSVFHKTTRNNLRIMLEDDSETL
jgi:predicted metal-dependent HD superfamily phosphohydrolase